VSVLAPQKRSPQPAQIPIDGPAQRIELMDVAIDAISRDEAIASVLDRLARGVGGSVMTPNLDHLRQHRADRGVRPLFDSASLVLADGMPLLWASRLQETPLPERVPGSELILSLTEAAAPERRRVFLLGGAPGSADRAAQELASRFPGIEIVGTHCPDFGFESDPGANLAMERAIRTAAPDLVYVGLPFPKADRLILRLRAAAPSAWFLALGVSFSFVAGDLRRAPRWMQSAGLEWLHRMLCEPRRLCRRYLIDGLPFAARMFGRVAIARLRRPRARAVIRPRGSRS
jgi:N-acetylglucosaminyldiphosphoundecaprenol N-acetyl-beta-D-mannosaminyltransferase